MSIITKIALCSVAIAMTMACLGFVMGDSSILSAMGTTIILSIPILLPFIVLYIMDMKCKKPIEPLFYWLVLGSFVAPIILHLGWNYMMLTDIMATGSLDAGQGYWLLINLFGGFKALIVGAAIGAICHLIFSAFFNER